VAAPFLYPHQFISSAPHNAQKSVVPCEHAHSAIRFSACREGVSTVQQSTPSPCAHNNKTEVKIKPVGSYVNSTLCMKIDL